MSALTVDEYLGHNFQVGPSIFVRPVLVTPQEEPVVQIIQEESVAPKGWRLTERGLAVVIAIFFAVMAFSVCVFVGGVISAFTQIATPAAQMVNPAAISWSGDHAELPNEG